jgi:hypothetical protein
MSHFTEDTIKQEIKSLKKKIQNFNNKKAEIGKALEEIKSDKTNQKYFMANILLAGLSAILLINLILNNFIPV